MNTIGLIISVLFLFLSLPGTVQLVFLTVASLLPKRRIPTNNNAAVVKLVVVIPAYNEEKGIVETLQALQACNNPLEPENIVVVADNCTDRTAESASQFGVTIIERADAELRGKGHALNFAFEQILESDIDAVVVIDADTTVDKNFIDAFRNLFANGYAAGQAIYRVKNANAGIRTRLMNIAFLAFNYLRPLGRDNANLSVGIFGNGFGLSAATLRAIPYDSFSIVEDLEYHFRLLECGRKVRLLSDTNVWSDMPETGADAQSQRERWEGGRLRIMKERIPYLISQIGKGNFLLLEPLLDLLLFPLAFHVVILAALLLIGTSGFKLYALIALAVVVLHVYVAMWHGKATWQDWKALLSAPFYIVWKIARLGGIFKAAGKDSKWKRTRR